MNRRELLKGLLGGVAVAALPSGLFAEALPVWKPVGIGEIYLRYLREAMAESTKKFTENMLLYGSSGVRVDDRGGLEVVSPLDFVDQNAGAPFRWSRWEGWADLDRAIIEGSP